MSNAQKPRREAARRRNHPKRRGTQPAKREPPLTESFHLLVKCNDESEQRDLYDRLTAEGRSCRVLSL